MEKKGEFDIAIDWINVSWGTMFPEDSYKSFFDWVGLMRTAGLCLSPEMQKNCSFIRC